MRLLVIVIFIGFNLTALGQLKQKMADQHFDRMEYYHCVDMYNELADRTIKGKGVENIENIRRAAISNYKLFKAKKAIHYFEALAKKTDFTEMDYEYFIQALRYDEQYEKASQEINKAVENFPENRYFNNLQNQLNDFNALFADSAKIKVQKTNISSQYGDFSPVYYQDGLIYATKSVNAQVLNGRSKWDNSFYINLLQTKFEPDSSLSNGKLLRHQFLDKGHDGPVAFTRDQQKMVITKNSLGKKKGKDVIVLALYFSEFIDGEWTELVPFEFNSDDYNVGHASFSDDGNTLYFSSDMDGSFGRTDLYRSNFENGKWTEPENLGQRFNTNMDEMFPFVIGNKLYFSSNGHFGLGGLDLFEVDLTNNEKPKNLGYPINTPADDFALISMDEEGLKGYFSSNREDNIDKIYSFSREKDQFKLLVNIFERYEKDELLPHQAFSFTNLNTNTREEYYTNDKGQLNLLIGANETYVLTTEKKDFNLLKTDTITTVGLEKDEEVISNLILLPTKIMIGLRVIAQDTRLPLDSATVNISNFYAKGNMDTTLITNDHGLAVLEVDRNKEFLAHGSKKGYIAAEQNFNTSNEHGRIIELELELPPITKGTTFKLDNIFYDFNASTLRPESMRTLDKLAEFIKENDVKIEISAHTDSRGSDAYNQRLSQQRAQSCVDYLVKTKGISPSKIIAKGYGESKPTTIESNDKKIVLTERYINSIKDKDIKEEYHQLNRRTEVTILDYDAH